MNKSLKSLLANSGLNLYDDIQIIGNINKEICGITCDSRRVRKNFLFCAVPGTIHNGIKFIDDAIENGCSCILVDNRYEYSRPDITILKSYNPKYAFTRLVHSFYDFPAQKLKCYGITGTNGKTTTVHLIHYLLTSIGIKSGMISTVQYYTGKETFIPNMTTPGVEDLVYNLYTMVKENMEAAVIEVSSHALDQGRCDNIQFECAVFTNLTRDHLDYHKDMGSYANAKLKLFDKVKENGKRVVNIDDNLGKKIYSFYSDVITYSTMGNGLINAYNIDLSLGGCSFSIKTPDIKDINISSPLIGRHSIYNILAGICAVFEYSNIPDNISELIRNFKGVKGRLQQIIGDDFYVFVDYAHTPDALKNVLTTLQDLTQNRLITVFGCGGERDKGKRPEMGKIASEIADIVIITSDNPRREDPYKIIEDILSGIEKKENIYIIPERKKAISKAMSLATHGDTIIIAGKGHENYQIIGNNKIDFDDVEIVKEILYGKGKY